MEHRWYGPDEPWPEHDQPWWTEALEVAREGRWHLITFSGHTWGKVVCSREVDDPHQKVIFSTGRGSENVARDLPKLVTRCKHSRDGATAEDAGRLAQARRLLDGAGLLLDAAEGCLKSGEKSVECEELLRLAEGQVGVVEGVVAGRDENLDALLELALAAEEASRRAWVEAYAQAAAADHPPRPELDPGELVAAAEGRLDTAERALADPPCTADTAALQARAVQLRDRVGDVHGRLERLKESSGGPDA